MEALLMRLMDENKKLIEELKLKNQPIIEKHESEETHEIHASLAKAQGEYPIIGTNRENKYFFTQYADLDEIMHPIRPILAKYGLSFTQQILNNNDGETLLHSKVRHSSGQWIESKLRVIPSKNDVQTFGSTLSCLQRYATMALLNITIVDNVADDDGELAMADGRQIFAKGTDINTKYNPRKQSHETITKEQLEELEYELAEYPDIAEQVLDGLKLQSLVDMPKDKYHISVTRVRKIKELRNNPMR